MKKVLLLALVLLVLAAGCFSGSFQTEDSWPWKNYCISPEVDLGLAILGVSVLVAGLVYMSFWPLFL